MVRTSPANSPGTAYPHRVGDADALRSGLYRPFDEGAEKVRVGPCRIHDGELDVVRVAAGAGHGGARDCQGLGAGLVQLAGQLDVGGGQNDADTGIGTIPEGLPGPVDVCILGSRDGGDLDASDFGGDPANGGEFAR